METCPTCGSYKISFKLGPLVMDKGMRTVHWRGDKVRMSPKMFNLLTLLIEAKGEPVPSSEIHQKCFASAASKNLVAVTIVSLRSAFFAVDPDFDRIKNISGVGYLWKSL